MTAVKVVSGIAHDKMRRPGIEPGPPAWKAGIITIRLTALGVQAFLDVKADLK